MTSVYEKNVRYYMPFWRGLTNIRETGRYLYGVNERICLWWAPIRLRMAVWWRGWQQIAMATCHTRIAMQNHMTIWVKPSYHIGGCALGFQDNLVTVLPSGIFLFLPRMLVQGDTDPWDTWNISILWLCGVGFPVAKGGMMEAETATQIGWPLSVGTDVDYHLWATGVLTE